MKYSRDSQPNPTPQVDGFFGNDRERNTKLPINPSVDSITETAKEFLVHADRVLRMVTCPGRICSGTQVQSQARCCAEAYQTGQWHSRQREWAHSNSVLLSLMNGNTRYVFWHGASMPDSEKKLLLKRHAGANAIGGSPHQGQCVSPLPRYSCGLLVRCRLVNDRYCRRTGNSSRWEALQDWASERMEERLAKMPVRTWS